MGPRAQLGLEALKAGSRIGGLRFREFRVQGSERPRSQKGLG